MTVWSKLSVLMILLCVLTACSEGNVYQSNISVPIPEILPTDWRHADGQHADTDGDGEGERIEFYRFDLTCEGDQRGCPINAAVYRPDNGRPPRIVPYHLCPPDKSYLCECKCSAFMMDALSGIRGDELIIRDECYGRITRLSIFNWEEDQNKYESRGHFSGHCIEIGLDKVEVKERLPGRAQLMMRCTYHPLHKQAYYQPGGYGALVDPKKCEFDFCVGEPGDVTLSPYPEKVVLAFFMNYSEDEEKVTGYFSKEGWGKVEKCENNRCGCTVPRKDVKHVRVVGLAPKLESEGPDKAEVEAEIECERLDGEDDGHAEVKWSLIREGDRWKLDSVTVTPVP